MLKREKTSDSVLVQITPKCDFCTLFLRLEPLAFGSTESTTKNRKTIWLHPKPSLKTICAFLLQVSCSNSPTVTPCSGSNSSLSPIGPIGRPKCFTNGSLCSESTTSSVSSPTSNYPKAPGFEREDQVHMTVFSSPLLKGIHAELQAWHTLQTLCFHLILCPWVISFAIITGFLFWLFYALPTENHYSVAVSEADKHICETQGVVTLST